MFVVSCLVLRRVLFRHVLSCHFISSRVVPCCVILCLVVSCRHRCRALSCTCQVLRVVPCHAVSCYDMSCCVVSCRVVSCRVRCCIMPCCVMPCRALLSCHAVSCLVVVSRLVVSFKKMKTFLFIYHLNINTSKRAVKQEGEVKNCKFSQKLTELFKKAVDRQSPPLAFKIYVLRYLDCFSTSQPTQKGPGRDGRGLSFQRARDEVSGIRSSEPTQIYRDYCSTGESRLQEG